MNTRKLGALALLCASALITLSGCTTRSVVRFEDHPAQKTTYVETIRHDNYYFSQSLTHEFWLCDDEASKLVCKPSCDGKTDLVCPSDAASVSFSTK